MLPTNKVLKKGSMMCIGCAEAVLMSSDGKTPETAETAFYLIGLVVWLMLLTHLGKKRDASSNAQGEVDLAFTPQQRIAD